MSMMRSFPVLCERSERGQQTHCKRPVLPCTLLSQHPARNTVPARACRSLAHSTFDPRKPCRRLHCTVVVTSTSLSWCAGLLGTTITGVPAARCWKQCKLTASIWRQNQGAPPSPSAFLSSTHTLPGMGALHSPTSLSSCITRCSTRDWWQAGQTRHKVASCHCLASPPVQVHLKRCLTENGSTGQCARRRRLTSSFYFV